MDEIVAVVSHQETIFVFTKLGFVYSMTPDFAFGGPPKVALIYRFNLNDE